jgi:hypothetical protein
LVSEKFQRVFDREIEHIRNAPSLVANLQSLPIVAPAFAHLAGHVHVGQKVHLDLDQAVALAGLAPAAFHIEGESARAVPSHLGIGELGEQLPDRGEEPGICRRIRAGGAPDGALVDVDHLVDLVQPLDPGMRARNHLGPIKVPGQRLIQDIGDQGGLPRAGDAGDRDEQAERDVHRQVLQVVGTGADHPEPMSGGSLTAAWRNRNSQLVPQVTPGQGLRMRPDIFDRAFRHYLTAEAAGTRAQVDDVIRGVDGLFIVLDHDYGVAQISQSPKRSQESLVVTLVQPNARLIQDVEHADQARPDLSGQADPLGFSARERSRGATEGEVVQTYVPQEAEPIHYFL